jgi:hypothetical protein
MTEPDLDRLDKLVDGEVAADRRSTPRNRRAGDTTAEAPRASNPEWSRTLVGLLERLLERLDRLEGDVFDVGKRVDTGTDSLVAEIRRAVQPLYRSEDDAAVLNGQVADLAAQVRELRAEVGELTDGLAALGVARHHPVDDLS